MLKSKVFGELLGSAVKVYLNFCLKKQVDKNGNKQHPRESDWIITNNGEITYYYSEAQKQGISRGAFSKAIDQLVEKGFIDITVPGRGAARIATKYAFSERWRKYGTADFESVPRIKFGIYSKR